MFKVVCVGQPKTGTKTIAKIFENFGLYVNPNPICINNDDDYIILNNNIKYYIDNNHIVNDDDEILYKNLELYEAFHDIPYSNNYEYIYKLYPNSKYILTLRDPLSWFNSLFNYQNISTMINIKILKKLYGHYKLSHENKEEIIEKYNNHNNKIIEFFKDKPDRLLVINIVDCEIEKNNELEKIGLFLNKKIDFYLPHENKQIYYDKQ